MCREVRVEVGGQTGSQGQPVCVCVLGCGCLDVGGGHGGHLAERLALEVGRQRRHLGAVHQLEVLGVGGHIGLLEGVGALDLLAAEAGDLVRAADLLHLLVDLHEADLLALLLVTNEVALARQYEDVTLEALDHDRAPGW